MFQGRAQIQKCKEYFARRRASASGGGAKSGRVFVKIGSDFVQKVPPDKTLEPVSKAKNNQIGRNLLCIFGQFYLLQP